MPIPVSVTGFANAPGAQSVSAQATNCEMVSDGPFAHLAQQNAREEQKSKPMQVDKPEPVIELEVSQRDSNAAEPLVVVDGLDFKYPGTDTEVINGMKMALGPGECCLLLGANGAGKTTLLKVLGGKHMIPRDAVTVLGSPPFHTTGLERTGDLSYIGGSWVREIAFAGNSVPLSGDFPAGQMIENIKGVDPERRAELMKVLDINPNWRICNVSDGQRRRVQLCIGLLKPYKVLLLDEITVDLDVLGRADLLEYLKMDCKRRNATIIYATHIFDGLERWATHIAFVARQTLQLHEPVSNYPEIQERGLLALAIKWLKVEQTFEREQKRIRAEKIASGEIVEVKKSIVMKNNGYIAGTLASSLKLPTPKTYVNPFANSSNAVLRN